MGSDVPIGAQPSSGLDDAPVEATVLRMMLGGQLRRLRETAGITPERAGFEIRASRSKIGRLETGRVGLKARDVKDLLTLYGVTDEGVQAKFLSLVSQSNTPDWWTKYNDILPGWFETYLGLESAASAIRSFEIQFVHGLFQTEDYARAVTRAGRKGAPPEEVEDWVRLRLSRQALHARQQPPQIWSVMDEAVLRRPVGGAAVMRAQLDHLIEMATMPHVTLQVIPFSRGGHAAESGSFTVLRFEERDLPDVVYGEQLTGAVYLDQPTDVERYLEVAGQLSGEALTPDETRAFIQWVARETQAVPSSHPQAHGESLVNEQRSTASPDDEDFFSAATRSGSGPPGTTGDGNGGSSNQRYHLGVPRNSPGGTGLPKWRPLSQAFTDGVGSTFDILGGIRRRRSRLPTFEDMLAQDARELCRELGLEIQNSNDSNEETGQ